MQRCLRDHTSRTTRATGSSRRLVGRLYLPGAVRGAARAGKPFEAPTSPGWGFVSSRPGSHQRTGYPVTLSPTASIYLLLLRNFGNLGALVRRAAVLAPSRLLRPPCAIG